MHIRRLELIRHRTTPPLTASHLTAATLSVSPCKRNAQPLIPTAGRRRTS